MFTGRKCYENLHLCEQAWSDIYAELEMNRTSQMTDDDDFDCSDGQIAESPRRKLSDKCPMQHIVTVCTAPIKDGGTVPRVDVYITFTGQYSVARLWNRCYKR